MTLQNLQSLFLDIPGTSIIDLRFGTETYFRNELILSSEVYAAVWYCLTESDITA